MLTVQVVDTGRDMGTRENADEQATGGASAKVPAVASHNAGMSGVAADGRDRVLSPLRILLAEDNLMIQDMMLRMLRSRGHDVTVANNGREAVAAVQGSHFDVVLMDVRMPEMDGHEAAAMIRAGEVGSATRVPIIAMTADVLADDRARCLASGMDDYLSKPSPPKVIVDTIARCLENLSRAGAKPGTTGGA